MTVARTSVCFLKGFILFTCFCLIDLFSFFIFYNCFSYFSFSMIAFYIYLFIHSFIYLFIYLFTYLPIYLLFITIMSPYTYSARREFL